MYRAVDLKEGKALVVTDLHGEWEPYQKYRDHFLDLYSRGLADYLIFLGDVIHGYRKPEDDSSLHIVMDIIRLQNELGYPAVVMLLGNHELPHVYGMTLTKGDMDFTPRFEHAMGEYRPLVMEFLRRAPFLVRTAGGVMMTHAGAHSLTATPQVAEFMLNLDHQTLLDEVDQIILSQGSEALIERLFSSSRKAYSELAHYYFGAKGTSDPLYLHLLRGIMIGQLEPESGDIWNFFFTTCEAEFPGNTYDMVLRAFLAEYSAPERPQHVLVTGHLAVQSGFAIISEHQLRMASWSHARPKSSGKALLIDVENPVTRGEELLPYLISVL